MQHRANHWYQSCLKPEYKELDAAIESGNLEAVKKLLPADKVNAVLINYPPFANKGMTPLFAAIEHGQADIVKYLLEQKCQVNEKENPYNKNPLDMAITQFSNSYRYNKQLVDSYIKITLLLVAHGARSLEKPGNDYVTKDHALIILTKSLFELERCQSPKEKAALKTGIGRQYHILGETELSFKWTLEAALENNPSAMWNLANKLESNKQIPEAIMWLQRSFPLFEAQKDRLEVIKACEDYNCVHSHIALASIHFQDGGFNKAEECTLKAIQELSENKITPEELAKSIVFEPFREYFNGLRAMHGWRRSVNTLEAIKIFEGLAKTHENQKPVANVFNRKIAQCYYQLALNVTETEIRSQHIGNSIQCYITILKNQPLRSFEEINEILNQLLILLEMTTEEKDQSIVIKTIMDYYVFLGVKCEFNITQLLATVCRSMLKNEFATHHIEAWKMIITGLVECHQNTQSLRVREMLIEQLKYVVQIADKRSPAFVYAARKALADCCNRHTDANHLKTAIENYEFIEKLSGQLEEKFDIKTQASVYHRFADQAQTHSISEAKMAYVKAGELGESETYLKAAAIAEQDEKQMDNAIHYYEKAMTGALAQDNLKLVALAVRQILAFKNKMTLSTEQSERIIKITALGMNKFDDKTSIEPHFGILDEACKLAQISLMLQQTNELFSAFIQFKNEKNAAEQEALKTQELLENLKKIIAGKEIFKNLINEYIKVREHAERQNIVKKTILGHINHVTQKVGSESKDNSSFYLTEALFKHATHSQILQNELLLPIEEALLKNEKNSITALRALYGFYSMQLQAVTTKSEMTVSLQLKVIDVQKKLYLRTKDNQTQSQYIKKNLSQYISNQQDPRVVAKANNAIDMLTYHMDSEKNSTAELAKRNYLPAVYDLFMESKKPTYWGNPHTRCPLYLATKILMLARNRDALERYGLPKKTMEAMVAEAKEIITQWTKKNISQFKKDSKDYQYCELATWYSKLLDTETVITNPDAFILQSMMKNDASFNMENLRAHVLKGIKKALNVDDNWIRNKIKENANHKEVKADQNASEQKVDKITQVISRTMTREDEASSTVLPARNVTRPTSSSSYQVLVSRNVCFTGPAIEVKKTVVTQQVVAETTTLSQPVPEPQKQVEFKADEQPEPVQVQSVPQAQATRAPSKRAVVML